MIGDHVAFGLFSSRILARIDASRGGDRPLVALLRSARISEIKRREDQRKHARTLSSEIDVFGRRIFASGKDKDS